MTAPRQVLPGTTYLVTRRCSQRELLLRPSRATNAIFLFLLAVAASRYGVQVHAYCVLSNHYHLVVTDTQARLPAFQQFLGALVARAINALLGRSESLWARDGYSAVVLATPADVVDKTAYVLANPVAAGLVRAGTLWPGLWSAPDAIGGEAIRVARPKAFFARKGSMPESEELELSTPPGFESPGAFREQVAAALAEKEAQAVRDHRGRFMGAAKVLAQKPTARPAQREPAGGLNPRVAARDKWKRIEVLGRLVEFLHAYREARAARARGEEVVFPCGTYQLRVAHGVPCVGFG